MLVAAFSIINQAKNIRLFQETFLMANVNPDIIFKMFFFTLNSTNIYFLKKKVLMEILHYQESFFTIKQVKLVEKKEFVVVAFNLGYKTFIIFIISFDGSNNN